MPPYLGETTPLLAVSNWPTQLVHVAGGHILSLPITTRPGHLLLTPTGAPSFYLGRGTLPGLLISARQRFLWPPLTDTPR